MGTWCKNHKYWLSEVDKTKLNSQLTQFHYKLPVSEAGKIANKCTIKLLKMGAKCKLEIDSELKFEPNDYQKKLLQRLNSPFDMIGLEDKLKLELYPSIQDLAKLSEIAYSSTRDINNFCKVIINLCNCVGILHFA